MRFGEIVRFELVYQFRRWSTWLYCGVILFLGYFIGRSLMGEAREHDIFYNSPLLVSGGTVYGTLAVLLVLAAIAGDAATRDRSARLAPLLYVTPTSRTAYLGGRFVAVLLVGVLMLALLMFGLVLVALLPGMAPDVIGPLRLDAFLQAFFLFALPSAFAAAAILFAAAALARHPIAAFGAAAFLFVESMFTFIFVAAMQNRWALGKVLSFAGVPTISELLRTLPPEERVSGLVPIDVWLLANRGLWVGVGLLSLAVVWWRFGYGQEATPRARRRWFGRRPAPATEDDDEAGVRIPGHGAAAAIPAADRAFGAAARARQVAAYARDGMRAMLRPLALAPFVIALALAVWVGPEALEHIGVPYEPTAERIVAFLGAFSQAEMLFTFLLPLMTVFLAGELVWRERDARIDAVAGAAPVPAWVPLVGKTLALSGIAFLLMAGVLLAGVLVQVRVGWPGFDAGVFLPILFGFVLVDYLLLGALAIALHVIVNQKYLGHLLAIGVFFFAFYADRLGIEHNLLIWASDPGWRYTSVSGYGPFVLPYFAFKAYWAAWALLLAVVARLLWVRGADDARERMRLARARLTPRTAGALAGAAALVLATGGFVFYNTNVLNEYRDEEARVGRYVRYERLYGAYRDAPTPSLVATRLRIDIRPRERAVDIEGAYDVVNRTAAPIDTIHLATAPGARTGDVELTRAGRPLEARVAIVDDDLGHRAYVLAEPLAPGDSLTLAWRVRYRARGFPNSGVPTLVVGNGTYFNNYEWMPQLGYQPQRELSNEAQRAEQGLPDRPAVPRLEDERAPFFTRHADVIDLDVVVGTDPDQVAVAPGALRRTWTEGGRRWFHYRPGAPIRNSFSILSARYDVHRARAGDVAIEVLHDPAHGRNAASFAVSMAASLEYYGARFGAYPHDHLRMVEFPGYANYLRAHPINIVFGEHFALLAPERDERDIDFPFAIVAHEVAHQWWGNALTPAHVEGGALLAESLAWYGALGVVEQRYGDAHLRRLLDMMRESYLTPRARADVPLLRASDWFVSYRKGPFAMYALREYVGEARVDAALRRFFETWAGRTDRLATSLDLYRELVAVTPDSLRPLLGDLFERNTFWSLGAVAARADSLPSGEWRVTLEFEAAKVAVDTAGVETPLPFDEPVEIGVFGVAGQGGVNGGRGEPLYRAWHPLRAGVQTVTVVVPARPGAAGVDPRLLLLDTEPFDNVIDIGADGRSAPRPLMQFSARESAARDRTALASLGR